jgi:hypothetical protein
LSDTQLNAIANRIADHVPGAHGQHHHHGGGGAGVKQAQSSTDPDGDTDNGTSAAQSAGVASKLSTSQLADLLQQLQSQFPSNSAMPTWLQALGANGSVDQQA